MLDIRCAVSSIDIPLSPSISGVINEKLISPVNASDSPNQMFLYPWLEKKLAHNLSASLHK